MRKVLGRVVILGAAAGTVLALRNRVLRSYLKDSTGPKKGDVQVVLDSGFTVEPDPAEAQEFADIARKILQISVQAG
ncbi:MAG: hypothetical protein M3315_08985 [Actinomycetota bacterium]|nr:hypothetical protein [Actinomycetota bacterium]